MHSCWFQTDFGKASFQIWLSFQKITGFSIKNTQDVHLNVLAANMPQIGADGGWLGETLMIASQIDHVSHLGDVWKIIIDSKIVIQKCRLLGDMWSFPQGVLASENIRNLLYSGQIIIFHQPRFPWNKGISLTNPPFRGPGRVRSLLYVFGSARIPCRPSCLKVPTTGSKTPTTAPNYDGDSIWAMKKTLVGWVI